MRHDMLVSLCVIAYNEERVLNGLFRNISSQTYPHQDIEVVLVDSNSTDNTRSMMEDFKNTQYNFRNVNIVTNSKHNQASAWNCALSVATGDVIIRIDAHAQIPRDFIRRCVDNLEEGEDIVGGGRPNIVDNETPWKLTLLAAEESLFGSSIAEYRRPTEKRNTTTPFFMPHTDERFLRRSAASTRALAEPKTTSFTTASVKQATRCVPAPILFLSNIQEARLKE